MLHKYRFEIAYGSKSPKTKELECNGDKAAMSKAIEISSVLDDRVSVLLRTHKYFYAHNGKALK